jgi:glycosyltransferase involved in cell wall biosynthesis
MDLKHMNLEESIYNILHTEWSDGWGGQEQRIILECRKVMALGHKVVIACQPGSGILKKALENGIPVEQVVMRGQFDLRAIRDLYRLIRKHDITVVNTHSGKDTWVGSLAAKLARVPLLIRTRHLSLPISTSPLNFVHKLADGIVTTGVTIRDEMVRVNGVAPDKIVSIATGVSLDHFNPQIADGVKIRQELGLSADCQVVTMVAVMRGMKRHDLLVQAAASLKNDFPQVKYLLVGEGPGNDSITNMITAAGLQDDFILTGYRGDIPDILSASDVVVLTSDRNEGVPQSLSQAMAMERAVIAAPIGSIPELIHDNETGLLAQTGDALSFATAIGRLLQDPELRTRLGKAARKHVLSDYTDDIMAARTIAFYRQLLEAKSGSSTSKGYQ